MPVSPFLLRNRNLDGQHNFDTHILALVHQLSVNNDLVGTNSVAHNIGRICASRNLDLAPLLVSRYKLSLRCSVLELFIDTLLFDTTFSLDEG